MYIVGFAETVRDLLREFGLDIVDGQLNDVRIVGVGLCAVLVPIAVTLIVLIGIVFIGTEFESKMQMILLVILSVSILDYFIGTLIPPNAEISLRGVTGYSRTSSPHRLRPQ